MGRQAIPTRLKQLETGQQKPHRRNGSPEPLTIGDAADTTIAPPGGLSKRAKRIWHRYARLLQPLGLLTPADTATFRVLVEAIELYEIAQKKVSKEDITAIGKNGSLYQHPAVGIRNKAAEQIKKFSRLFGMSPSDRASLEINGHKAPEKEPQLILHKKIDG